MRFKFAEKLNVYHRTKHLVDAGIVRKPMWLDEVKKSPPKYVRGTARSIPKITFPEDELVRKLRRQSQALRIEDRMMSKVENRPSLTRQLARKQLALMERGMPEGKAFAVITDSIDAEVAKSKKGKIEILRQAFPTFGDEVDFYNYAQKKEGELIQNATAAHNDFLARTGRSQDRK